MADIITGVFPTRDQAIAALRELRDRGYSASDIGIATLQAQARAAGAPAPVGQPFEWIPDHRSLPLSGQSNVLIAGQIAEYHGRDGGNQNTIAGLLMGLGIQPEHAKWYDQQVCEGNTLVTLRTNRPPREAELIMCQNGTLSVPSQARMPHQGTPGS